MQDASRSVLRATANRRRRKALPAGRLTKHLPCRAGRLTKHLPCRAAKSDKKKAAELLLHVRRPMHAGYEGGAGFLILGCVCTAGLPQKGDSRDSATIRIPGEVAEWLKAAPC